MDGNLLIKCRVLSCFVAYFLSDKVKQYIDIYSFYVFSCCYWECSAVVDISRHGAGCPQCGSYNLRIDEGDSLQLKQLAVE